MANSKGSSNVKNLMYNGRHGLLPPRIPFSSISPSYVDYVPGNMVGSKAVQKPKEGSSHHQRTSSETLVLDEQPSWLDDLLNEPDTPVRKGGHRRSSSDSSFAYKDVANSSSVDFLAQDEHRYRNMMLMPMPIWGSQDFEYHKDARQSSLYADANIAKPKNWAWDPSMNTTNHTNGFSSSRESAVSRSPASAFASHEAEALPSSVNDWKDQLESGQNDSKAPTERKDNTQPKSSTSENDSKRAKQQFAQRSRVRKLQYIAELERNVQALQAEGSEFSAELEFLNQQNLILSMENKALKQRLESLAQEHLIKRLEHDVLESEIGRLRTLFQKQQQQQQLPQSSAGHRRTNSRDLECQLANLSLKQKGANSGRDPVTGSLRIWSTEI